MLKSGLFRITNASQKGVPSPGVMANVVIPLAYVSLGPHSGICHPMKPTVTKMSLVLLKRPGEIIILGGSSILVEWIRCGNTIQPVGGPWIDSSGRNRILCQFLGQCGRSSGLSSPHASGERC